MLPSGRFFQFNIGSTISFQLRAGFASISNGRSRQGNRLPHQTEELEGTRKRDLESKRYEQADFYEVIDPAIDESSDFAQRAYPAAISLPNRTADRAALVSSEISLDKRDADQSYQRRIQRKFADKNAEYIEYVQSYNRNGQKVVGVFELPAIDLVI